jgi:2-dehydro-3-deoxyglucarate aldolase/4-hydroxy-2-oxoheptanedioate aldolase
MNGTGSVPLVRAPWNDFVTVKRILDAGAYGVLFPYVNTRADAEAAVRACRYPPQGIRGVAASPRAAGYGQNAHAYLTRADEGMLVMVAIETPEAAANLDDILSVPGVEAVFIGPMDLATSMGHPFDPAHPDVQAAIADIEARTLAAGRVLATIAASWSQGQALYERGYQMLMLMADGVALGKMAAEQVAHLRAAFPEG